MGPSPGVRLVITGCGGSATKWATTVFESLGVPCGHQEVYKVGGVRRRAALVADSSFFAAPLEHSLPVLWLIRDPLKVVRSLDQMPGFLGNERHNDDRRTTAYICHHRPAIGLADDRLGRILRYVATWDNSISGKKVRPVRVEKVNGKELARIMRGVLRRRTPPVRCSNALQQIGTKVNTHGGPNSDITWDDIENHPDGAPVVAKAERWGYR